MRVRTAGGAVVHECGMCGARYGERRVVHGIELAEEARARGIDAAVWPLVKALEDLPSLCVFDAVGGDPERGVLPFVAIGAKDPGALLQLENLTKSLLLGAAALHRHWVLEVEYQRHLAFVLKPRHPGGAVAAEVVRAARSDLGTLQRHLVRDAKLGWWRTAGEPRTG